MPVIPAVPRKFFRSPHRVASSTAVPQPSRAFGVPAPAAGAARSRSSAACRRARADVQPVLDPSPADRPRRLGRACSLLDPVSAKRCTISLSGPRRGDHIAFSVTAAAPGPITVHSRRQRPVPAFVRLAASCTQSQRPRTEARAVNTRFPRRGKAGHGDPRRLGGRRDIRVDTRVAFADVRPGGRVSWSKAPGANPSIRPCTSTPTTPPGFYDRAVAAGVRPSGRVATPPSPRTRLERQAWAEKRSPRRHPDGPRSRSSAPLRQHERLYGPWPYVEQCSRTGRFRSVQSQRDRNPAATRRP